MTFISSYIQGLKGIVH